VRVYINTSIIIDYVSQHGLASQGLFTTGRRGQTVAQLYQNAKQVFERIADQHQGATSTLTYLEIEDVLYRRLNLTGVAHAQTLRVIAARPIVMETWMVTKLYNVTVLDLTSAIVERQVRESELQRRGIRSADALHMASAIVFDADIVLAGDDDLLGLNNQFRNSSGDPIRCVDTHVALGML